MSLDLDHPVRVREDGSDFLEHRLAFRLERCLTGVEENLVHHVDTQLTAQPLDLNLAVGNLLLELGNELVLRRLKLGEDRFFGLHFGFELLALGSNLIEQVLEVRNAAV